MRNFLLSTVALFILAACGQNKPPNTRSNVADTLAVAFYPKDHKLTAQERKEFSDKFLKQKGVPVLEHLPLVEDFTNARFRNEKEVAQKAVVLYGLIYVAHGEKTAKEMIEYFKEELLKKDKRIMELQCELDGRRIIES